MHGIIDARDKNAGSFEMNCAVRATTKAAEIDEQMLLDKATVKKLETIEDDEKIVEAVGSSPRQRWQQCWRCTEILSECRHPRILCGWIVYYH